MRDDRSSTSSEKTDEATEQLTPTYSNEMAEVALGVDEELLARFTEGGVITMTRTGNPFDNWRDSHRRR